MDTFLNTMERLLFQRSRGKFKNTLLIVTADHGLADVTLPPPFTSTWIRALPVTKNFREDSRRSIQDPRRVAA